MAVVVFRCVHCGDTSTAVPNTWLVRGDGDQMATRCPECDRLVVVDLQPCSVAELMAAGVQVIGTAELQTLIDIDNT